MTRKKTKENDMGKTIFDDLCEAGLPTKSIINLASNKATFQKALPILKYWLPRETEPMIKEAIIRVISVPWARNTGLSSILIEEFQKKENNLLLKWTIGNALSIIAGDQDLNELVLLIRNEKYGKAREMLVVGLGRMKIEKVEDLLIELLWDPNLMGYAVIALGKSNSIKALPYLVKLTENPKTWIRNEAKKAVQRIQKASNKKAS